MAILYSRGGHPNGTLLQKNCTLTSGKNGHTTAKKSDLENLSKNTGKQCIYRVFFLLWNNVDFVKQIYREIETLLCT